MSFHYHPSFCTRAYWFVQPEQSLSTSTRLFGIFFIVPVGHTIDIGGLTETYTGIVLGLIITEKMWA